MKTPSLRWFVLGAVAWLAAGCGHLDVAATSDPNRVLQGRVTAGGQLPAGAEVVVRLIANGVAPAAHPPTSDLPVAARAGTSAGAVEQMLGEQVQTLASATTQPVPFRVEYRADDAMLRRGLNLDVRISVGGKLRYRTINAHVITLASAPYPQEVMAQPVQ
jgi:uncharacterized lipoprotein YbaY